MPGEQPDTYTLEDWPKPALVKNLLEVRAISLHYERALQRIAEIGHGPAADIAAKAIKQKKEKWG